MGQNIIPTSQPNISSSTIVTAGEKSILKVPNRRVSSARTRWGSASAGGAIRLNRRLIHLPPEVIDYVVVHELAHLHEMNHSARFWQHVARVLPDFEARRERLKNVVTPLWGD